MTQEKNIENPLAAFERKVLEGAAKIRAGRTTVRDASEFNNVVEQARRDVCSLVDPATWSALCTLINPNKIEED